ncbi:MAG: glycoside hydrolase family 28 protein [Asticcacaulis sp.]
MSNLSRRSLVFTGLLTPALISGCATLPRNHSQNRIHVEAPFDMPPITVPDFGSSPRFMITDFGAAQGDLTKTTNAIAQAIEAANLAGSGVVVIPEGIWLTGKIHLRSHVCLHVSKGATLLFSEKPEDYLPPVHTTWEGIECMNYSPLIYAYGCENVAITGEGTLRAKLDVWKIWYARPKAHMDALVELYNLAYTQVPVSDRDMTRGSANLRPQFVQFNRCRNVLVEDISIEDSPFWVMHPYLSRDVVIRRIKVRAHGHNNDGVDPEMSQNVLIEDCVFDQGDDAISVKSGRDMDAWRLNTPSKNIVMRNCRILNGHQLMAIGSELSGGVENVFVDNCHFTGDGNGADGHAVPISNLLFVKTNERRGGFVKNIHVSNVSATKIAGGVLSVETDVLYQWRNLMPTYVRKLTTIEGLHLSHISVNEAAFVCHIKAEAEAPVKNVSLKDIKVQKTLQTPVITENVEGFVHTA